MFLNHVRAGLQQACVGFLKIAFTHRVDMQC